MMRYLVGTILGVLVALSTWGCQTNPPLAMITSTPMPSYTATFTPTPKPTTTASVWQVYSYTRTISPVFTFSVEYPSYRQAEAYFDNGNPTYKDESLLVGVTFPSPVITNQATLLDGQFGLSFHTLPYKHRSNSDPRYTNPNFPNFNMGGGVVWFEPIQVAGGEGLLYVLFDTNFYSDDTYRMYSLNLVAYHRDIEASIQAGINFSSDDWVMVTQRGFTATIHQRFQSFIHMVKSLQVVPDPRLIKPTPTPIPQPVPQPPTATTWITEEVEGVGVIEYPAEWQILDYYTGNGRDYSLFTLPVDGGVTDIPPNYVVNYGYEIIQPGQPITKQDFQSRDGSQVEWEEWLPIAGADGAIMQVRREAGNLKLQGTVYRNPTSSQPDTPIGVAIGLGTTFDAESMAMAQTQGFTQTIATRFQVFRHMVETIKFLKR